jgi:hypothetical protein
MKIVKRHEWGAKAPNNTTPLTNSVRGVALHWVGVPVTGDPEKIVLGIQRYHMETKSWWDIAYNICVSQDGRAFEGRGWRNRSGANGSSKLNKQYAAICCLIGPDQKPTDEMVDAVRDQVAAFRRVFPRAIEIVAHSDLGATSCPGPDLKALLEIGAFDPANPPKNGAAQVVSSGYPIPSRLLKRGSRGDDVRWLQHRLNIKGAWPKLVVDGIFGKNTRRAVKRYQKTHKTSCQLVDGIVGPMTLASLMVGSHKWPN